MGQLSPEGYINTTTALVILPPRITTMTSFLDEYFKSEDEDEDMSLIPRSDILSSAYSCHW